MCGAARKQHRRESDQRYENSDRALLDSRVTHWPSCHNHLHRMLLLPTALPDLTSRAKPHCLHTPTSASPCGDSIHVGPCLCWRSELYGRFRIVVKTKKRFIEQKTDLFPHRNRRTARLNPIIKPQFIDSVEFKSHEEASKWLFYPLHSVHSCRAER